MNDDDQLPPLPILYRTLSLQYTDPTTGQLTSIDPNSSEFSPAERNVRESAVLRDLPNSGYADSIRAKHLINPSHLMSCSFQSFFNKPRRPDDNNDNAGAQAQAVAAC